METTNGSKIAKKTVKMSCHRYPEFVEGHPELVEGHPEPATKSPEPAEGSPELAEGQITNNQHQQ